ncbi:MAG: LytTR family transcriptional regulator DNA-binding domain-containing protein [Ruminiclostridium sp.]|nr:LytTR family transcriptional regulator DNA-binding domain-containing protein [Ruminiclostridium sp.]
MKQNGNICVVMMDMREDYRDDYVVGIERQANKMGYNTTIFSMPMLNEMYTRNEESVFDLIDFDKYDGVVFFEMSFSSHKSLGKKIERTIFEKCKKPVVVIGESNLYENALASENSRDSELMTNHVIEEHGSQVLYFLGGYPNASSGRDVGFVNSMKKHGLVCTDDNMIYGGYWLESGEKLAKDIAYNVVEKPDAVVCYDDAVAFFFIKALAKYGIRVPEDIIVVGFGAKSHSRNNVISITTFPSDGEYIGRKAVVQLYSLLKGELPVQISYPRGEIITGVSCGCGIHKPLDIRRGLELHEKRRMEEIYYHNSELEERLYSCKNYDEIVDVVSNTHYLIPDKEILAVNLRLDNKMSKCIYMTEVIREGNFVDFETMDIYPKSYVFAGQPKNVHVLPIMFNGKVYGHVAVGYNEPVVYNFLLKRYVSRLAVAFEVLSIRGSATEQNEQITEPTVTKVQTDTPEMTPTAAGASVKHTASAVFVLKDGSLNRVPVENIQCFESEGRKTFAVLKSGRYEIKKTLTELEELMSSKKFMRISKSVLVNMEKVVKYVADSDRTLIVTLTGQIEVKVSRGKVSEFKEAVDKM